MIGCTGALDQLFYVGLITCLLCLNMPCQTAEEIDQLTVDEDLNDVERAVYLLRCVCGQVVLSPDVT